MEAFPVQAAAERKKAWTLKHTVRTVVFDKEGPLGLRIGSVSQDSDGSGCPAHVKVAGFYGDSELFWQESNIKLSDVLWKIDGQDAGTSCDVVRGGKTLFVCVCVCVCVWVGGRAACGGGDDGHGRDGAGRDGAGQDGRLERAGQGGGRGGWLYVRGAGRGAGAFALPRPSPLCRTSVRGRTEIVWGGSSRPWTVGKCGPGRARVWGGDVLQKGMPQHPNLH